MSNPGYLPIKSAIVTILEGVTSLKKVYSKEEKAPADFPAACVSAKDHTATFCSVGIGGTNERKYNHLVRIYFRTDEENDSDYEDILESVADDVIFALESNIDLNGSCEYAIPTSGVWRFGAKQVPVRFLELTVTASVHIKRDTGELV